MYRIRRRSRIDEFNKKYYKFVIQKRFKRALFLGYKWKTLSEGMYDAEWYIRYNSIKEAEKILFKIKDLSKEDFNRISLFWM